MILRNVVIAILLGGFASISHAAITIESEVRYEQVTANGTVIPGGVGPVAADVTQTYATPNAQFKFETVTGTTNPFELKAKARLEVDIDARGANNPAWQTVTANARAVSGLVDTAIIDGVPGQAGGFVEFVWLVDGISTIKLTPKLSGDAYGINELETVAILNPSEGGGLFVEVIENDQSGGSGFGPGSNSVDSNQPGLFEQQIFAVDWFAGQEFDVFFELAAVSRLEIAHGDAAGFTAVVDADFGNTAILEQIRIYDNDGNILPDATMRSTEDPMDPGFNPNYGSIVSVPEPNSATLLLVILTLCSGFRFCRKFNA